MVKNIYGKLPKISYSYHAFLGSEKVKNNKNIVKIKVKIFSSSKMEVTKESISWLSGINITLSYGEKGTIYVYCVFLLRKK